MKCDLHVHSVHSGMCQTPVLSRWCRECYAPPDQAYDVLKRRGMDLVTLTDHDSIGAAEILGRHADFFLSEEVTCQMPSGTEIHMGVYDITERQHVEMARRRNDLFRLLSYLNEQHFFFSINHLFSHLTGRREREDFELFEVYFPAIETRNGQMLPRNNQHAARLARKWRKAQVAGSDAHTLGSAGSAFTEVSGARNKAEFLAGLRAGWGRPCGDTGNYWKLTRDVLHIALGMMNEKRWTLLLAPLALLVPACTLGNHVMEIAFCAPLATPGFAGARGSPANSLLAFEAALRGSFRMIGTRAVAGYIEVRDFRLMRRVHRWCPPLWVRLWMLGASRLGDGWIWYGLGVIILLLGGEHRFVAVGSSALAAFVGILLFSQLKRVSGRQRPCALEPHCWASVLPPDQYSFPSGHSITAFAIVIPLSLYYPHLADVLLFLAVSIAISRILLGMHFLSDVLAGALIGAGLGYSSYSFLRWMRFS